MDFHRCYWLLATLMVSHVVALPDSSQTIIGDVRIQTLSETLARVEVRGPRGFEDRNTFMAVNRSAFAGVPIIKTYADQDGNTRVQTDHYTLVLANQTKAVPQSPNKDTCGNIHAGIDAAKGSKRIAGGQISATQAECCAACNKANTCIAWVLGGSDPEKENPCWLMETFIAENAGNRISGGVFTPPAPTPAPPADYTISIISQDNVTVLMQKTKCRAVSTSLHFPMPADFNDGKLLSWAIRDSPRFVPSTDGVVPPGAVGEKIDPLLVNTSGFDLRNAATDVYIFFPGAVAATTASTAATTASAAATSASISASNYGYTGLRREYLTLTGPIPTLPDKAFGTWFSWYHPYNQTGALADIARWKSEDLPLDIWGLDMNWRITAGGMEGKEYKINTKLFPNMTAFMESAHKVSALQVQPV
jgi:hypothetical protein